MFFIFGKQFLEGQKGKGKVVPVFN